MQLQEYMMILGLFCDEADLITTRNEKQTL